MKSRFCTASPGTTSARRVHEIMADRNDPEAVTQALAGRQFEIVFDNVYDWERGTTAAQVEATAQCLRRPSVALCFHVERGGIWRRAEPP